jgi:tripartite-type tricarboxylate transporter receptor subunit TctC
VKRLLLAALLLFSSFSFSQSYPSRPVKVLVPFSPGSATAAMAMVERSIRISRLPC